MEIFKLEADVSIFYFNVPEFPNGIEEKFTEILHMLPDMNGRTFYGISYFNEDGAIVYNCGVNEIRKNEGKDFGGEHFLLPAGEYLSSTIHNWMSDLELIKTTLMKLMDDPRYDKNFPCIEVYKTDKVLQCLVKIA